MSNRFILCANFKYNTTTIVVNYTLEIAMEEGTAVSEDDIRLQKYFFPEKKNPITEENATSCAEWIYLIVIQVLTSVFLIYAFFFVLYMQECLNRDKGVC